MLQSAPSPFSAHHRPEVPMSLASGTRLGRTTVPSSECLPVQEDAMARRKKTADPQQPITAVHPHTPTWSCLCAIISHRRGSPR